MLSWSLSRPEQFYVLSITVLIWFGGPITALYRFVGPITALIQFVGPITALYRFVGPITALYRFVGPITALYRFVGPITALNLFGGPITALNLFGGQQVTVTEQNNKDGGGSFEIALALYLDYLDLGFSLIQEQIKVWSFSSLFSPVERWSFSNTPSMSDHLKTCCFYQREERREPVALACLGEVKHGELKHQRSHSRSDVVGLQ